MNISDDRGEFTPEYEIWFARLLETIPEQDREGVELMQRYNLRFRAALRELGKDAPTTRAINALREGILTHTAAIRDASVAKDDILSARVAALEAKLSESLNREARLVRVVAQIEARLAALAENADLDTIENYIDAGVAAPTLAVVPIPSPEGNP